MVGEVACADEQGATDFFLHTGLGSFHIATGCRGHVDDHAARSHGFDHRCSENTWSGTAEDLRRGDDDVRLRDLLGHHLALLGQLFFGQRLGIALRRLPGFAQVHFDKLRTETLHLFLHRRTRVEGFDFGTKAFRCGNGLQACDTGTDDEDLRCGNRPRRCHHHGEHAIQTLRPENDRSITRETGLRAEHIHLLRDRRARNHFHADGGHSRRCEFVDQSTLPEGIEIADVHRTPRRGTRHRGSVHAHDQTGLGKGLCRIADHLGSLGRILLITPA